MRRVTLIRCGISLFTLGGYLLAVLAVVAARSQIRQLVAAEDDVDESYPKDNY